MKQGDLRRDFSYFVDTSRAWCWSVKYTPVLERLSVYNMAKQCRRHEDHPSS